MPLCPAGDRLQVYTDRPATCRYYPIGQGTLITEPGRAKRRSRNFSSTSGNRIAAATKTRPNGPWPPGGQDQGVEHYDEMNLEWKTMMLRRAENGGPVTDEQGNRLFAMVMYDLDQFRQVRLQKPLPEVFAVDEDILEKIWDDDEELLKFGYQYVKTVLKIEEALKLEEARAPEGGTTMTF